MRRMTLFCKNPPWGTRWMFFKKTGNFKFFWLKKFQLFLTPEQTKQFEVVLDKMYVKENGQNQGLSNTSNEANNAPEQFSVAVGRTEITRFQRQALPSTRPIGRAAWHILSKGLVTLCAGVLAARLSFFRTRRNGIMSEKIVRCNCQHCNQGIEFDATGVTKGETRTAICPHCQLDTILFVPANSAPPALPLQSFKGTILNYSIQTNQGVISGENGQRYSFQGSEWKDAANHPTKGGRVDFVAIGQSAKEIYVIGKTGQTSDGKRPSEYDALYRSSDEKTLGGVCGGLAHKYGVSRGGWQIIFMLVSFCYLAGVVVYIVMWLGFKALPTKGIKFED